MDLVRIEHNRLSTASPRKVLLKFRSQGLYSSHFEGRYHGRTSGRDHCTSICSKMENPDVQRCDQGLMTMTVVRR